MSELMKTISVVEKALSLAKEYGLEVEVITDAI